MLTHSHRIDESSKYRNSRSSVVNEVGRILIDDRVFLVTLAESPEGSDRRERCRFEMCGFKLVVLEKEKGPPTSSEEGLMRHLTGRELEIAILVAQGLATKNIAYRLQISEWTVSTHLRRIFAKLNVDSRAAMVYRCASQINGSLSSDI